MDPKTLQFNLTELKEKGKLDFAGVVGASLLDKQLTDQALIIGPIDAELKASWKEEGVWLDGRAKGQWQLECCRCLEKLTAGFSVPIRSVVEDPEPTIDGVEEIRQSLVLAVPTQPYCKPDCKGLCPGCGADRNKKDCGCNTAPPSRFKITKRGQTDA